MNGLQREVTLSWKSFSHQRDTTQQMFYSQVYESFLKVKLFIKESICSSWEQIHGEQILSFKSIATLKTGEDFHVRVSSLGTVSTHLTSISWQKNIFLLEEKKKFEISFKFSVFWESLHEISNPIFSGKWISCCCHQLILPRTCKTLTLLCKYITALYK